MNNDYISDITYRTDYRINKFGITLNPVYFNVYDSSVFVPFNIFPDRYNDVEFDVEKVKLEDDTYVKVESFNRDGIYLIPTNNKTDIADTKLCATIIGDGIVKNEIKTNIYIYNGNINNLYFGLYVNSDDYSEIHICNKFPDYHIEHGLYKMGSVDNEIEAKLDDLVTNFKTNGITWINGKCIDPVVIDSSVYENNCNVWAYYELKRKDGEVFVGDLSVSEITHKDLIVNNFENVNTILIFKVKDNVISFYDGKAIQ